MSEQLESLLVRLIEQQEKLTESINRLAKSNEAMIDLIAQDQDGESEPQYYMDGTPIL